MKVAVIGVNHHKAPIEIREKVAFTESKKIEAIDTLLDKGIKEVIIISTCNRSEIHIVVKNECIDRKIDEVMKFYGEFFKLGDIREFLFYKKGIEAVEHIYRVSAGLDSIVLGEDQILGQVKDSLLFSMEMGASKKILNKLFREAVTTAKKIKRDLKISENPLSISYIGVKFLKEKIGSFEDKKVFIIGAGEMGKLALKHVLEENPKKICMTNRSHERLLNLSLEFPEVETVRYEKRFETLETTDILITATGSPHTVISKEDIAGAKDIHIMDIALPRDVERDVEELSNVHLYDIDDLKKISDENVKKREELAKLAMEMIKVDMEEFIDWAHRIKVDNAIKSLNEKRVVIENDTYDYLNRKLDLSCRERRIVEKMISSALKRMIREPIINLKEIDEEEKRSQYLSVIDDLFEF